MHRIVTILCALLAGCGTIATEGPPGDPGPPGQDGAPGEPYSAGDRLVPLVWRGGDNSRAVVPYFYDVERGEECSLQIAATYPIEPVVWRCMPPIAYGGTLLGYVSSDCTGDHAGGANSSGRPCHMATGNVLYCRAEEIPTMYVNDGGGCQEWGGVGPFYRWPEVDLESFVAGDLVQPE